jgi:hypothetical protein
MTTYTTAQIDAIVAKLESCLSSGTAEVEFQSRRIIYRSTADIRNAIAYFNGLYPTASDAPTNAPPKIRTFLFYGSKGFGNF